MGFWSKLFSDVLQERNEQDIDRIWAKNLGMKKEDEQTFYRLMRDKREIERMKRDTKKNK